MDLRNSDAVHGEGVAFFRNLTYSTGYTFLAHITGVSQLMAITNMMLERYL